MKQQLWVGLASLCASAVVAQLASDNDVIVTDGVFVGPDKVDRTLEGICHYSEDEVTCWDVGGTRRPELKARLLASLAEPAARLTPVPVAYGHRSLCLLFRDRPQVWRVLGANGGVPYPGNFGPIAATVPKDQKQFSLRAEFISKLEGDHLKLDIKAGATTSVPGLKLSFIGVQASGPPFPNITGIDAMRGNTLWVIKCALTSVDERPQIAWAVKAVGSGGTPIDYVDLAGNPISAARYLELTGNGAVGEPKALTAQTLVMTTMNHAMPLYSNINPKHIQSLSFVLMKKLNVQYKDIPAYPKENE